MTFERKVSRTMKTSHKFVVCRDQPVGISWNLARASLTKPQSGKSSYLESLCGLKFPTNAGLWNRIATKFSLHPDFDETIAISIVRDIKRPRKNKPSLPNSNSPSTTWTIFQMCSLPLASLSASIRSQGYSAVMCDVLRSLSNPNLTVSCAFSIFHTLALTLKVYGPQSLFWSHPA